MARSSNAVRRRQPTKKGVNRPNPQTARAKAVSTTLDPAAQKQVNRLFCAHLQRVATLLLGLMVTAIILVDITHSSRSATVPMMFFSALVAIILYFPISVNKLFGAIKAIGREHAQKRRYADAVYALENFHRIGNMSLDPDGEAHYYLTESYLGLDKRVQAEEIMQWLLRHRKKSEWTPKAEALIARASPPPSVVE